jgi:O-antigen/teichoic acid export membrane protein
MNLKTALLSATIERHLALILNFAVLIVTARLLTPEQFGVIAIGLAIFAIAAALRELATPEVLIKKPAELSEQEIATALNAIALLAACIATICVSLAGFAADYYDEPDLRPFINLMAVAFLLETLSLPSIALMKRRLQYGLVARASTPGFLAGAVVTIACLALGVGPLSVAYGAIATSGITAAICILQQAHAWKIELSPQQWKKFMAHSACLGTETTLFRLYDAVPSLFFGHLLSVESAGIFNRATNLCRLPEKIILSGAMAVIMPAFSQQIRSGGCNKAFYLSSLAIISAIFWPALLIMALFASTVVSVMFGDQWGAVVPIMKFLCVAFMLSFAVELNLHALNAAGAVRTILKIGTIIWPLSAIILIFAAYYGLQAVAIAMIFATALQFAISFAYLQQHMRVSVMELGGALYKSAIIVTTTAVPAIGVLTLEGFPEEPDLRIALTGVLAAASGWLLGLLLTRHPLQAHIRTLVVPSTVGGRVG